MTGTWAAGAGDPFRYGVYLRPDPRTCWAVTAITAQLRAQYGLLSAGAFPPHATLLGSEHLDHPAHVVEDTVSAALQGVSAFEVHNAGVRPQGVGLVYDVSELPDGRVNPAVPALAARLDAAFEGLRSPAPNPAPLRFDPALFRAHLSLASHDLYGREDLREELEDYVAGLPVDVPATFAGDTVALYQTTSEDWSGRWWTTLRWRHLRTWRLAPAHPAPEPARTSD